MFDPHVRIEGKCRACSGEGQIDGNPCGECGGQGTASALVRLSEVVSPLSGAELVGTAEGLGVER